RTDSFGAGDIDCYIVKLDATGTVQWTRTVGGIGSDDAKSIVQTGDGGYAVAGRTTSFGAGGADFYIVKLDTGGNTCCSTGSGGASSSGGTSGSGGASGSGGVSGSGGTFSSGGTLTVDCSPCMVTATITGTSNICSGDSTTLTTSGGGTYLWSTGDTNVVITVNPAATTTYYVTVNDTCGTANDSITVTVTAPVTTSASPSICTGDSILLGGAYQTAAGTYFDTLTAVGGCDSIITTSLSVDSVLTTVLTASICSGDSILLGGAYQTTAGTYFDTLTTGGSCDSIIATSLSVDSVFTTVLTASICPGDSILLGGSNQTTAGTYFDTLTAGGGCDSIIATILNVDSVFTTVLNASICSGDSTLLGGKNQTTAGTYFDTLTAVGGCDSIIVTTLTVNPLPNAFAGNDTTIALGASAQLYATGGGAYSWSPPSGLSCTNCANPVASPENTTVYYLAVSDLLGCSDVDSVIVTVDRSTVIFIPNIFSPNGDGQNDMLDVQGKGVKELEYVIYNRWGEKVFESSDLENDWDGTLRGKPLNPAVFVYYVEATFTNGKEIKEKGNITLIR
ncbi:gliding motility-associated C-terminal domain-containing protein, partial [Candidatus Amoebophilus asiaticus]|nr:gliding motility-associated C-terminal domain-containing protein [Candidatus Amoebophilus asiaticus]